MTTLTRDELECLRDAISTRKKEIGEMTYINEKVKSIHMVSYNKLDAKIERMIREITSGD